MIKRIGEIYFPNIKELTTTSFLSLLGAGVTQELFGETIHGIAVILVAIIAAIAAHAVKYYLQKKWPLK